MDFVDELLKNIPLRQLSLITGKLLGDGNLTIDGTKQPRFRFQHRTEDYGWCFHCYNELKNFVPINPPKYSKIMDSRMKAGFFETFYVQSRTSIIFTILKNVWYNGNKKVLPLDLLKRVMSAETLAWWYQDDGHLVWKDGKVKKLILSTDSFTKDENLALIELVADVFNVRFSLDGKNRLCLYDQPQIMFLLYLVQDYIHPAMARKLPPYCTVIYSSNLPSKRTTIYLPFWLPNPTSQIKNLIFNLDTNDFVNSWYHSNFIEYPMANEPKYSYQIRLSSEELLKINLIQRRTGLRMSQIIFMLFNDLKVTK